MKQFILAVCLLCFGFSSFSQSSSKSKNFNWKMIGHPIKKIYPKSGIEFGYFNSLYLTETNPIDQSTKTCMTPIRFTMFTNGTYELHYNFTRNVGFHSGIEYRNLGYAFRKDSMVYRARNYYVGIPLILKIGKIKQNKIIMLGGGIDFPFHFKSKSWVDGKKGSTKVRNSEWFSKRATTVNPYLTAAIKYKALGVKATYYLSKFYNSDYIDANNTKPYALHNGNLFSFACLFDVEAIASFTAK